MFFCFFIFLCLCVCVGKKIALMYQVEAFSRMLFARASCETPLWHAEACSWARRVFTFLFLVDWAFVAWLQSPIPWIVAYVIFFLYVFSIPTLILICLTLVNRTVKEMIQPEKLTERHLWELQRAKRKTRFV